MIFLESLMHGDAFFSPDDSDYERHSILRIKKSFRGTQVRYTQMTQIYTYNEKDEEGFFCGGLCDWLTQILVNPASPHWGLL